MCDRDDTNFWINARSVELPKSLKDNLEIWKNKLPISEDLNKNTSKVLFNEYNHAIVLHGLGLFNTESIKEQFQIFLIKSIIILCGIVLILDSVSLKFCTDLFA